MNLFKSLLGLKYITFGFVFIIVIFSFSHQAFANSYSDTCADGNTVTSTVNITPVGPFQVSSQTQTFEATGQIYSTCSTRMMSLKANNNGGAWTDGSRVANL